CEDGVRGSQPGAARRDRDYGRAARSGQAGHCEEFARRKAAGAGCEAERSARAAEERCGIQCAHGVVVPGSRIERKAGAVREWIQLGAVAKPAAAPAETREAEPVAGD